MNLRTISIGVIGVVVGIVVSGSVAAYAVNGKHTTIMQLYAMNTTLVKPVAASTQSVTTGASMSMNDMTTALARTSGAAFDAAFLSEMTTHHQGAIAMAQLALTSSTHKEIQDMAHAIITAQTSEIAQMKTWQTQWGYTTTPRTTTDTTMPGMGM
jgi:uncharacterized protein (DUF305 family)